MALDSRDRATTGNELPADDIYRRYAQRLVRFAERRIGQHLARRFDAEDIVQSAFRTFFRRDQRGEYWIESSHSLWQLLVQITLNKIRRSAKFHLSQRRDVRGEVYADDVESGFSQFTADASFESLFDTLDEVLAELNALESQAVRLTLQGYTVSEVAQRVGFSRTSVWRILQRARVRLRRRVEEKSDRMD